MTNLRSSTVFIDSWVGSDGTYPDHVLLGREYDAAQIRRMVRALKYLCWTWAIDWPRPTSSEEAILAAKIREFVEAEKTNLDELNGIADALDAASRK